jgi:hypothetical protein
MWKCEKCGEQVEDNFDSCRKCANGGVEIVAGDEEAIRIVSGVALATTPTLPGSRLVRSLGVVCGEATIGANIVSDMIAGVTSMDSMLIVCASGTAVVSESE